jgi:lipid II:glycine glycyltransferase (peptidoglycan interpeptide bridge formation enzyme)
MIKEVLPGEKWNKLILESGNWDFYFLSGYQSLNIDEGNAVLLCYEGFGDIVLFPVIKRSIPDSDLFDLTSVYGYSGPIYVKKNIDSDRSKVLELFKESFRQYCKTHSIVTCFSRLHPLINQDDVLNGMGEIINLSETISINLLNELSVQRKQFRKGVKSDLSRLRKRDVEVFEDVEFQYIDDFIEIYNENMKRVNAKADYFFPKEYYLNLFGSKDINAKLFFIRENGLLIAGSIFVFTKDIVQYHLSGTRSNFLQNSPVRLLIDHVRILGTEHGFSHLHLGGGVGGQEDSLFNFKAGFSKVRNQFKVWKFIVDGKKYEQLVFKRNNDGESASDGFFPAYRR